MAIARLSDPQRMPSRLARGWRPRPATRNEPYNAARDSADPRRRIGTGGPTLGLDFRQRPRCDLAYPYSAALRTRDASTPERWLRTAHRIVR
jgi:hypothetical protein